jgi:hypothetical protein
MSSELLPPNPATLAGGVAQQLSLHKHYHPELPVDNKYVLSFLEDTADDLDLLNSSYWVEARRALSIPAECDDEAVASFYDCDSVAIKGSFITYSTVEIGKLIGGRIIDALCLAFEDATIYPNNEIQSYKLPENHLLHVPVLAVECIDAVA